MVSKALDKNNTAFNSMIGPDAIILLGMLLMSFLAVSYVQKYNNLVDDYYGLKTEYGGIAFDMNSYENKINDIDQLNQKFALVLENVDNAIESDDIKAARKAIYLFDDEVDGIPVKIFANVKDNVSLIVEDIRSLHYKNNINSIKIKNMEVTEVMTIEGNESTFGVGGKYFPDEKRFEMYSYFTEGLIHEDCHHIEFDKIEWDDRDSWIYLNRGSNSSDFVSYYSKRNEREDFAETCTFVFMNKSIANTSILNKKVSLVKKYV